MREALDCINQIRLTQNEIRILQQQQQQQNSSLMSSPSLLLGNNSAMNLTLTNGHDSTTAKRGTTVTMRRGVLMSILQQAALTLPLWVGEIGQSAPAL